MATCFIKRSFGKKVFPYMKFAILVFIHMKISSISDKDRNMRRVFSTILLVWCGDGCSLPTCSTYQVDFSPDYFTIIVCVTEMIGDVMCQCFSPSSNQTTA